jgi:multisubunit Na+/H+ antiporter MnhF subunit
MNEWEIAAAVLTAALIPCAAVCLRAGFAEGVVGVQLSATLAGLALLVLSEGEGRQPFASLALVLVVLSFAGTLIFLRFLERQR